MNTGCERKKNKDDTSLFWPEQPSVWWWWWQLLKWGRVWLEVMKSTVVDMQVEILSKKLLTQALSLGGKYGLETLVLES